MSEEIEVIEGTIRTLLQEEKENTKLLINGQLSIPMSIGVEIST